MIHITHLGQTLRLIVQVQVKGIATKPNKVPKSLPWMKSF